MAVFTEEPRPRAAASVLGRVDAALDRATAALLAHQNEKGWWIGEDEANPTLDAEYIFFFHFVGLAERPKYRDKIRRLANRIRSQQRADGTWAIYWGGPGELAVAIECYFAMKLAGDSPDAPHMKKARELILARGGPLKARVLTRFQLALLGQLDWEHCPALPVQLMFAPKFARFNIYDLSYWARVCTVPLSVIRDYRRSAKIADELGVAELFPEHVEAKKTNERADLISWRNFFIQSDRFLKWAERVELRPFRAKALARAERWIRRHQDPSGDWGGIFPAMVNSLMALFVRGVELQDPVFRRGLEALERFEIQEGDELHIAPCTSPVWDTAWSVCALSEARVPHEHRAIRDATEWLASMQIRRKGDWRVKCPDLPPGGWAFQFYNDRFPDTDDASVVLMALTNAPRAADESMREVRDRGLRWVLGLQNADGGWGAFERDVDDDVLNETVYSDEKNMLDPSTSDVTGRVLECLGYLGTKLEDPIVVRALAFLRRVQEPDGKWWGRWGVNFVYGTWSVLRGLAALGVSHDEPMVARAATWLESFQSEDGGWGESCASYLSSWGEFPGGANRPTVRGPSTASQTAWAVMGLIAAGRARSESARRGVEWLLEHQRAPERLAERPHGLGPAGDPTRGDLWLEREFTGTGFPNAFYLRYHMYPVYFPILALAAYRNALACDRDRAGETEGVSSR